MPFFVNAKIKSIQIMKNIIVLFLAVFSPVILADDLVVTITPPLIWTNGDTVNAGDIAAYDIGYDCAGVTASAITDQLVHTFNSVPDGSCIVTGAALDQNGQPGAMASATVTTGLSLGAPGIGVAVDTGTSLNAILAACEANVTCTSVTITP
jgi:hypothetical protein